MCAVLNWNDAVHSIIISHPPDFFARGCHYDYFLHHSFFLVSRWRQRNWLKKRLRSKGNTSWYVPPFLLYLVAASSLLFYCMFLPSCLVYPPWLCLHYDPELAALLSASKNYPFTYTVCWNVSKLDIKKVIVLANMMIQSVWKSLKNVLFMEIFSKYTMRHFW